MAKILAFAGSLRSGSFNRILLRPAVEGARKEGAEVTVLDFREYPFPGFEVDLARGISRRGARADGEEVR